LTAPDTAPLFVRRGSNDCGVTIFPLYITWTSACVPDLPNVLPNVEFFTLLSAALTSLAAPLPPSTVFPGVALVPLPRPLNWVLDAAIA
jgi:hypothetical protein